VFNRGFGLPSGGCSSSEINATDPVVAARCLTGNERTHYRSAIVLTMAADLPCPEHLSYIKCKEIRYEG
jgi:hypothetical protein